jgi:hypothetical protein
MAKKIELYDDWLNGLVEGVEELRETQNGDQELIDHLLGILARIGSTLPKAYRSRDKLQMAAFEGDGAASAAKNMIYQRFIPAFALMAAAAHTLPGTHAWRAAMDDE